MLRSVTKYFLDKNKGLMPSTNFRRRVRDAIFDRFPGLFPSKESLIGHNIKDGFLGTAFIYAYRKCKTLANSDASLDELDEGSVEAENVESAECEAPEAEESANTEQDSVDVVESHGRDIEFLTNAVGTEEQDIHQALKNTSEYRRESLLKGEVRFVLDLFFRNPKYLDYDFELLWPEKTAAFMEKKDQIFAAVNSIFIRDLGRSKPFVDKIDLTVRSYGKILTLLYNCSERKLLALIQLIFHEVHENTSTEDISALSQNNSQPFIVIRRSHPPEYMIACDGRLITLSQSYNIDRAFDLLLKLFHLWHIKYGSEVEKFYVSVDALSFKIGEINPRSSKIIDFIGRVNAHAPN